MLAAPDAIYPQFATHNAHTIAAVAHAAPATAPTTSSSACTAWARHVRRGRRQGQARRAVPHLRAGRARTKTLLAYLVRRLLENGANTSFVNRIVDRECRRSTTLVADPVAEAGATRMARRIRAFRCRRALSAPARINSRGIDSRRPSRRCRGWPRDSFAWRRRGRGSAALLRATARGHGEGADAHPQSCRSATTWSGSVVDANPADAALRSRSPPQRAAIGRHAPADARAALPGARGRSLRSRRARVDALAVREAGKTLPNAIGEVREAVDFCRYYAAGASVRRRSAARPTGERNAAAHARRVRLHLAVEFPAGDLRRPGHRRTGRRQCGARQARRADAADRRRRRARCCTMPACPPTCCNSCPASGETSARRWSATRASPA